MNSLYHNSIALLFKNKNLFVIFISRIAIEDKVSKKENHRFRIEFKDQNERTNPMKLNNNHEI